MIDERTELRMALKNLGKQLSGNEPSTDLRLLIHTAAQQLALARDWLRRIEDSERDVDTLSTTAG